MKTDLFGLILDLLCDPMTLSLQQRGIPQSSSLYQMQAGYHAATATQLLANMTEQEHEAMYAHLLAQQQAQAQAYITQKDAAIKSAMNRVNDSDLCNLMEETDRLAEKEGFYLTDWYSYFTLPVE